MPLDYSDFSDEVQVAFFMFDLLEDSYVGMEGVWVGKDWSNLNLFLDTYSVGDRKTTITIMKLYEAVLKEVAADRRAQEAKKAENAAKQAGGKNFVHRVQG